MTVFVAKCPLNTPFKSITAHLTFLLPINVKMFSFDFESWNDIFLEHFLVSVLISVIFVIATLIISMKYGQTKKLGERIVCSENDNEEENSFKSIPVTCLKKSPALVAEKIIQAKMTDEQRTLEYE
ncbi:unnamed protein product [Larinioides sclopetarius]|uniref:Uncharacterized protein n=1 Tax=Larinioides sclopetarius TaxID=280406 RepID=A0AAV1Z4W4_9ARAC